MKLYHCGHAIVGLGMIVAQNIFSMMQPLDATGFLKYRIDNENYKKGNS